MEMFQDWVIDEVVYDGADHGDVVFMEHPSSFDLFCEEEGRFPELIGAM